MKKQKLKRIEIRVENKNACILQKKTKNTQTVLALIEINQSNVVSYEIFFASNH